MARVEGVNSVKRSLAKLQKQFGQRKASVIVGYTQSYAVYVHEINKNYKAAGSQWKYLETPARRLDKQIGQNVSKAVSRGATLEEGLVLGGLLLQRESQQLVPIETSALRASAFTAIERTGAGFAGYPGSASPSAEQTARAEGRKLRHDKS